MSSGHLFSASDATKQDNVIGTITRKFAKVTALNIYRILTNYMIINYKKYINFTVLALLSMWPLYLFLLWGESILTNSAYTHYLPLRMIAVRTMLDGHLPLWNPYILTGMTMIGDAVTNPFDVLNVMLVFFKPDLAFVLLTSTQLLLSGIFMYIYLKDSFQVDKNAALIGGILYIFNPVLIYGVGQRLDFVDPPGTFLWFPLIMLFVDRALKSESHHLLYALICAGLSISFAFFSGNGNLVFFMICFIALYVLLANIKFWKKSIIIMAIGVIALLTTAIQLFPTWEAVKRGHRTLLWQPSNYDVSSIDIRSLLFSVVEFPMHLIGSATATKPFAVELSSIPFYLGIASLFLLICIYIVKSDPMVRSYKISAVVVLFFAIGSHYLPIKGLVNRIVPGFKGMHIGYSIFTLYFCIIVLTAFAADHFIFSKRDEQLFRKAASVAKWVIAAFMMLIILAWSVFAYMYIDAKSWNLYITLRGFGALRVVIYLLMLSLLWYWLRRVEKPNHQRMISGTLLIVIMLLEAMLLWESQYIQLVRNDIFSRHFESTKETAFLSKMDRSSDRVDTFRQAVPWKAKQTFLFNLPALYNASTAGGSHQLMSDRYRMFFDMINLRYPFDTEYYWKDGKYVNVSARAYLEQDNVNFNALRLLGVKYLLNSIELNKDFLEFVEKGDSYYIYKFLEPLPRAFVVYQAKTHTPDEILAMYNNNSFNPMEMVFLERSMIDNAGPVSAHKDVHQMKQSECKIARYSSNSVEIQATSSSDGYLVFNDAYSPGWKAYIDEVETEILRANYLFRAVALPAGGHTVRFEYMPKSFVNGARVSILTIIVIGLYMSLYHVKLKHQ